MSDCYKVKKTVVEGTHLIEHRYQAFPETFVGKWKKIGVSVRDNPSVHELVCKFCLEDWKARVRNWHYPSKLRSYRVEGVTGPDDLWEWGELGICSNPVACWGPKERIWDVRRSTSSKSENIQRYSFAHHTITNNIEKTTDRLYATFVRGTGKTNLEYTAITNKASQSADFWPDCLPVSVTPRRQIYLSMSSKHSVPEDVGKLSPAYWPETYRNSKYMNPHRMEVRYFDEQPGEMLQRFKRNPLTLESLENYLPEIARTSIEMYPGGSGLKVLQYKWIPKWKHEENRDETDWLPHEWKESYNSYIPEKQHGWAGPVISYWARLDETNRYFS